MIDAKFVRKHLDVSTAHVTKEDMDLLNPEGWEPGGVGVVACGSYPYGVTIFIVYHNEPEEQPGLLDSFREVGFSEAFCNLYKLAWEMDVDMILLDQDAELCAELPTFDW